jgi:hypothetical protein
VALRAPTLARRARVEREEALVFMVMASVRVVVRAVRCSTGGLHRRQL